MENEIKIGLAGILSPLLRNLSYLPRYDSLTWIKALNFAVYEVDPELSTDEILYYTPSRKHSLCLFKMN